MRSSRILPDWRTQTFENTSETIRKQINHFFLFFYNQSYVSYEPIVDLFTFPNMKCAYIVVTYLHGEPRIFFFLLNKSINPFIFS